MENIINIKSLLGCSLRSRCNAEKIRVEVKNYNGICLLDFNGVSFISRSFSDELCNIMDDYPSVKLINEEEAVSKMINIVLISRKRVRKREYNDDMIIEFDTMKGLYDYIATI